jgi:Tol biopolymer transport system component
MKLRSKAAVVGIAVIVGSALAALTTHAASSSLNSRPINGQLAWDPCALEARCATGEVVIANPNGRAKHLLRMPWQSSYPVWSPDGTRLLVTASRPGKPDGPATMNPDGSGLRLLNTGDPNLDLGCVAWSPDGTRLLCAGDGAQQALKGIYTVRSSDGGDLTRLTTSPSGYNDGAPSYSPDGSRFAFVRATNDQKTGALFVGTTDGTKPTHQITAYGIPMTGGYEALAWSPDGTEILFTSAAWSLDTIHPDGTGLHKLIHGQSGCPCAFSPAWSPDGTRIVYAYNPSTASGVYTANADGTHRVKLTNDSGQGWPSWGTHPLAPNCTAAEKAARDRAVATYKRQMAAARRAYFRTHHSAKARTAFGKAQRAKLKALEQRVAACG